MKSQEYSNRRRAAGRVAAVVAVLAIAGGAVAIGTSNALTAGTAPAAAAVAGSALPASFANMIETACDAALAEGFAKAGDRIVITAGVPFGTPGSTNTLRIAWVDEGMSNTNLQ